MPPPPPDGRAKIVERAMGGSEAADVVAVDEEDGAWCFGAGERAVVHRRADAPILDLRAISFAAARE